MAELHGGELVLRQLQREGCGVVFALTGGHIAHTFEAADRLGMDIVDVRHEAAAAHMAEAYARITGKPGVCLVTAGPGFTNCLTGVQNAKLSCCPMVVISGRAGVAQEQRLALQDMDQLEVVKPMCKWAATVHQMSRIPEYISTAFRRAMSGQPGPTYVEIPVELMFGKVDESKVSFLDNTAQLRPSACDRKAVAEALDMLAQAERPVVVAGSGAFYSGAREPLIALVERTGLPLFTLNGARGYVPDSHPQCFGAGLVYTIGAAATALPGADVLLMLGTRMSMYLNFGEPPIVSPQTSVIQVDIERGELGRNRELGLGIPGDVRSFCEQALVIIEEETLAFETSAWTQTLKDAAEKSYTDNRHFLEMDGRPIHPLRLCHEIDRFLGERGTVISDGGDTQAWMPMIRRANSPASYMDSGLFGCLGVGFPFAVAAKYLKPDEPVVLFNGDGTMGFNLMEFETAVRHKLPIVVVVNNDLAWGMIKHGNELSFGKDTEQGSELGLVRYDRVAEALGGYGELVRDPAQIRPALERAAALRVPSVINVLTDTTAISPGTVGVSLFLLQSVQSYKG